MRKISLNKHLVFLEQSGIQKAEISKIMDGLRVLEKEGVAAKDLDMIIKNIVKDPNFRALFLKDPLGVTYSGGWSVK